MIIPIPMMIAITNLGLSRRSCNHPSTQQQDQRERRSCKNLFSPV